MMNDINWMIGGGVLGLVAFSIKTYIDMNNKVDKVHKRLDIYRNEMYGKFTNKEVCEILHKQVKDDLVEIKLDVKKLLSKNGIT